jgi:hypothetical protein
MSDTSNTFPTSLNSFTTGRATDYLVLPTNWNALHAAVNAIETKLGIGTYIAATKVEVGVFAGSGMATFPGGAYFGDTSNANMTLGLTINQGAADDEALALKSSDVAHGVTSVAETDTYARFQKYDGNSGGLTVNGFSEAAVGLQFGAVVTTEDNGRSTSGTGALIFDGFLKSGTTVASMSANRNIAVIRNNGTTRFIFDSDGDSHQDVGTAWTNFDDRDDVAALNLLAAHVSRADDPLRANFGDWLAQNREPLEQARLVTFNDDGHHFVNMSRLAMLLVGAVRQVGARLDAAESRLALLGAA